MKSRPSSLASMSRSISTRSISMHRRFGPGLPITASGVAAWAPRYRDEQRGGVALLQDHAHLLRQPLAQVHVQTGEGLVQQQQAGPRRQRAGHRHALLLAAGQLVRRTPGRVAQAHQIEHLLHAEPALKRTRRRALCRVRGAMGQEKGVRKSYPLERLTILADASHLHCIVDMKTSTLPAVRVEPSLRSDAEAVLDEGESLSDFVASCVREGVAWRRTQDAFLARASDAVERSEREDSGISPQEMLQQMDARLEAARQRLAAGKPSTGQ